LLWICCGFVVKQAVQQPVQQIHNKSNKWSPSITITQSTQKINDQLIQTYLAVCILQGWSCENQPVVHQEHAKHH